MRDQERLLPGMDWKHEIRRAIRRAYAVVICFSQEVAARHRSGIYPEALLAIEEYRLLTPGSIYLIPVRLSDCEIPPIELTPTRTLQDRHCEDLFPPRPPPRRLGTPPPIPRRRQGRTEVDWLSAESPRIYGRKRASPGVLPIQKGCYNLPRPHCGATACVGTSRKTKGNRGRGID